MAFAFSISVSVSICLPVSVELSRIHILCIHPGRFLVISSWALKCTYYSKSFFHLKYSVHSQKLELYPNRKQANSFKVISAVLLWIFRNIKGWLNTHFREVHVCACETWYKSNSNILRKKTVNLLFFSAYVVESSWNEFGIWLWLRLFRIKLAYDMMRVIHRFHVDAHSDVAETKIK